MAQPYILARTLSDAHTFARDELGLSRGHYRIVMSPSSISAVRGTNLYLVPGWEKRHDRFAMKSALRWTRLNQIDVAELRQQAHEPAGVPDGLEPLGEQLTLEDAHAFLTAHGTPSEEIKTLVEEPDIITERHPAPVDPVVVEAPAEEPKPKRRRRRCKDCGELVHPDEIDQHAADHLPVED